MLGCKTGQQGTLCIPKYWGHYVLSSLPSNKTQNIAQNKGHSSPRKRPQPKYKMGMGSCDAEAPMTAFGQHSMVLPFYANRALVAPHTRHPEKLPKKLPELLATIPYK